MSDTTPHTASRTTAGPFTTAGTGRSCGAGTVDDVVLPLDREGSTRRSFLRMAGFGVAAGTLTACTRGTVKYVVPRPEGSGGVVPGRAYWVATTCGGCEARCGVLAKCRDGRPIKLEGNPQHGLSRGGLCAVGQASLLDLYDGERFGGPRLDGAASTWEQVDARVSSALRGGGKVRLLTRTIVSPSTRAWIERLTKSDSVQHVEWDPRGPSAMLDAYEAAFGERALPRIRLEHAEVIASFDADFLGTWVSPVEFAKSYSKGRRPDATRPTMSRHVHVESALSLTGAAADTRIVVAPAEQRALLGALVAEIAAKRGRTAPRADHVEPGDPRMAELATELVAAAGKSVVLCGVDDPVCAFLALAANELLGNHGAAETSVLDVGRPSLVARGSTSALRGLFDELAGGDVDVLVVDDLDLVRELPDSWRAADALGQAGLFVCTNPIADDTTAAANVVAPRPHELESWNDAEPVRGRFSFSQPVVPPLRTARTLRASIAAWLGKGAPDRDLLRDHWRGRLRGAGSFDAAFDRALHDGWLAPASRRQPARRCDLAAAQRVIKGASSRVPAAGELALVVRSKVGLPEGRHAHNPWLQEMPDPLTTHTWDNPACLAPETAAELGVRSGDHVVLESDGGSVELPACVVPGQHKGVVAVARGYGVAGTGRFSRIGPRWIEERLTVAADGRVGARVEGLSDAPGVRVRASGGRTDPATTQDHHRLEVPKHLAPHGAEVRDAVRGTTLAKLIDDPAHAVHRPHVPDADLWPPDHVTDGPRWGLTVDLSACIGCSGCVVSCQAENNVPVVGKDEIRRHREMTWLRMDRYFVGHGDALRVVHQPMMCQHCANAPCETVCPVLATVHSEDGLNQQVYNRCVGTRYCANNCPYKTRRFNWFDYERADELRNLALNPDVTVRTRGVMEKCSMCIQRIQEGKAEAGRRGREVADGDVRTACQQSCPTDAIVFGNLDDPESAVAKAARRPRAYGVLSEINVRPSVTYLAEVRNVPEHGTSDGESHR